MPLPLTFKKLQEDSIQDRISSKLRGLGILNFRTKPPIIGPIVTGYPIELHVSTPINKIISKSEDIALACGVDFVDIRRIGSDVIIFVPNEDRKIVDFKDAIYWYLTNEEVKKMELPILLGMDFQGNKSALDLAKQPHILIAGSTGSGKSVLELSIISALSTYKSSEELKFYLVDTKRVELTLVSKLPHVKKIARDAEEWYELIKELDNETRIRTEILERNKVRNIQELNAKLPQDQKLPYIVLVIDELADLIEKDGYVRSEYPRGECPFPKVTLSLRRLVQICRATGVHIIACTQRTSVNIVDGVIKANFPTRISLKLPSQVDSRTILDQRGAETLLGKGDFLLRSSEKDILERFHAPFVRLEDISTILSQQDMIRSSMVN